MATTPTADRLGDIVEPLGAKFAMPLPLLWQHHSRQPVGHVTEAKPTKDGIGSRRRLRARASPPTSTRRGPRSRPGWCAACRSASAASNTNRSRTSHGLRFKTWEWLELSLVTIPANAEASIQTIKPFDVGMPAATGQRLPARTRARRFGANPQPVKAERIKTMDANTPIAEQISAFEASRAAKTARLLDIIAEAAGATLDAEQKEEYDDTRAEVGRDRQASGAARRDRAAEQGRPPSRSATKVPAAGHSRLTPAASKCAATICRREPPSPAMRWRWRAARAISHRRAISARKAGRTRRKSKPC